MQSQGMYEPLGMHTYIRTYVRIYIHTEMEIASLPQQQIRYACIHTYVHTYVRTYIHTYRDGDCFPAATTEPLSDAGDIFGMYARIHIYAHISYK